MPLSELVVLLQQPPATTPYFPALLQVVSWPPIDYIPALLPKVPVVVGGPPPQTNWFAPLSVTPWPAPQYQAASLPQVPPPSPSAAVIPSILVVTAWPTPQYPVSNLASIPAVTGPSIPRPLDVTAWPQIQYQPVSLSQVQPEEPVTGPFFPAALAVTPWPPIAYVPVDLPKVPPTPSAAVLTGIKLNLRGVKRRPKAP